ncbi:AAA family ATPase [Anabaena sp. UHCC 0253]|uniref:NB-ARC domain-containing protein n=1 Tax=Anabaena sp. UHCC 0253 TaxID=2590019 RepID=UPI001444BFDA|nr:NB-ARC domain-containing protein [Anabaena sp. UHCC 0253]MTJ55933.1 AAA family ATPase [Anabaena sp. UHCC 0253]
MAASLRLSQEGLKQVELARCKKDWDADATVWYDAAHSSKATLKRFRAGIAIQQQAFIALCQAVGIDDWEKLVDENPISPPNADNDFSPDIDNGVETWQKEKTYRQFVGRNLEIEELLKYLESDKKNKVLGIIGILGIGGLGKTALCHQLVSQAYQAKLFTKIAWIRAKVYQYHIEEKQTNSSFRDYRLTLEDAIKGLGSELKLPHYILQDIGHCKTEITKILNQTKTLIVIDGLEDTKTPKQLANELRSLLGQSTLIITSRKGTESDIFEYRLGKFNRDVSREFIKIIAEEKYPPSQNPIFQATETELETILNITDGMPLAMKLLVSQLKNLDLDRIVERFETVSEEQALYDYLFEDSWQELCSINAFNAQSLLIRLADRNQPIPRRLLYEDELSKEDVDESLQILAKLSLVDLTPGLSKQVSLHSFTSRYFRYTLREKYEQFTK